MQRKQKRVQAPNKDQKSLVSIPEHKTSNRFDKISRQLLLLIASFLPSVLAFGATNRRIQGLISDELDSANLLAMLTTLYQLNYELSDSYTPKSTLVTKLRSFSKQKLFGSVSPLQERLLTLAEKGTETATVTDKKETSKDKVEKQKTQEQIELDKWRKQVTGNMPARVIDTREIEQDFNQAKNALMKA